MLFNSLAFFVFSIVFFVFWPILRKANTTRWLYLTIASFVFYGWWNWYYIFLLFFCGLLNYAAGWGISKHPTYKKLYLSISIAGNVAILAFFKYLGFIAENINTLLGCINLGIKVSIPHIILPVGISFYTFQAMSYTIDIYKGNLKVARSFLHFMSYLCLFPQLVAGPIVRASDLLPKLEAPGIAGDAGRWEGLKLIIWGYFKKVVIADVLSQLVDLAFDGKIRGSGSVFWWVIMLAFTLQIYGDFSGYSDIARGLARWMGYDFPVNFNHPYAATNIQDFWRKWHISLSTWFKDYLYIPLGGNRCSVFRSQLNLLVTMLVSGVWHGANWTFVLWGALHGFLMVFLNLMRRNTIFARLSNLIPRLVCSLFTFICVVLLWVFFRATNITQAGIILKQMLVFNVGSFSCLAGYYREMLLLFACLMTILYLWVENDKLQKIRMWFTERFEVVFYVLLGVMSIFCRGTSGAFIYFQF